MKEPAVRHALGIVLILVAVYFAFPIEFRLSDKIVDSGPTPAAEHNPKNPESMKPYRTKTECHYVGGIEDVPYTRTVYTDTPDPQDAYCGFVRFEW